MKTITHRSEKLNKLKHKKHKENYTMANDSQMSQHQWYKNVVRGGNIYTSRNNGKDDSRFLLSNLIWFFVFKVEINGATPLQYWKKNSQSRILYSTTISCKGKIKDFHTSKSWNNSLPIDSTCKKCTNKSFKQK